MPQIDMETELFGKAVTSTDQRLQLRIELVNEHGA
jgi:hypothetical protein